MALTYAACYSNLTLAARQTLTSMGYSSSVCSCTYDKTVVSNACAYANVIKLTVVTTAICNYAFTWNANLMNPYDTTQFSPTSDLIVYGLWTLGTCTSDVSQFCVAKDAMTTDGSYLYTNIQISLKTSSSTTARDEQSCITKALGSSSQSLGVSGLLASTVQDLNECQNTTLNDCSKYATCTNVYGSYACTCNSGYTDRAVGFMRLGTACSSDCGSSYYWEYTCINIAVVILLFLLVALQLLFDVLLITWCCIKCCHKKALIRAEAQKQQQQQQQANKPAKKKPLVSHHWVQTEKIFESKFDSKMAKVDPKKPEVKGKLVSSFTQTDPWKAGGSVISQPMTTTPVQTDAWSGNPRVIYRDIGDKDYMKPGEERPRKPVTKNEQTQTDPVPVTLKPPVPIEQPKSPFKPKVVVRPTEDPIDIYYDHDKRPEPNDKPLPTETRFIPPNPYEYDPMGGPAVRHRSQPSVRRPRSNSADWMIPRPVLPQF